MLYNLVENKIQRDKEKAQEITQIYANNLCKLLETCLNELSGEGDFLIFKNDFNMLGRKKVPCSYTISDDKITLILDYSFYINLLGKSKSFDKIGLDYFSLKRMLEEKGIVINRETEHPEYEIHSDPIYCEDKLIICASKEKRMVLKPNNK